MRQILLPCLMAATLAAAAAAQTAPDALAQAGQALQAGDADRAMSLLQTLAPSAESHNLRCRVQFALEHMDAAAGECEEAVRLNGQDSGLRLWLGRAVGERASRASFLSAFSLARRAREEFEQSVRLDPRNAEALADLGEFYTEAPAVVGGGTEKAQGVAADLERIDPVRGHQLRGRIAEAQKDYPAAEREFRQAVQLSPHPAFAWVTLASYYRRRSQWEALDGAIDSAVKAVERDRRSSVALFNGASVLTRANRNPALAAKMLESYLAGPVLTEEAPAFVAHTHLARLRAELGDREGAGRERARALALAHDYKPAQELRF